MRGFAKYLREVSAKNRKSCCWERRAAFLVASIDIVQTIFYAIFPSFEEMSLYLPRRVRLMGEGLSP
jgi:hypothetical protein